MSSPDWIEIGVIGRAHGVRGWVRLRLGDPESAAPGVLEAISLGDPARRVKIVEAERDASGWRVRLEGFPDRTAVEALRGKALLVPRDALPPPDEDEVYVVDLVGCEVFDVEGRRLGAVVEVRDIAAQELLLLDGAGDVMIPFVDGIVTSVDVEARRIVVDPPEGLLDINRAEPKQP